MHIFSSYINETSISSTDFQKIIKYKTTRNFFQWKPNYSMLTNRQTEGETDRHMAKLMVVFRNFANERNAIKRNILHSVLMFIGLTRLPKKKKNFMNLLLASSVRRWVKHFKERKTVAIQKAVRQCLRMARKEFYRRGMFKLPER